MRTSSLLIAAAALLIGAPTTWSQTASGKASSAQVQKPFEIGKPVDARIALPGLDGKTHRLADLRGKVVVIDFWSINCPVSQRYEDKLKKLVAKYPAKDVVFLAIASNRTEIDTAAEDPYHQIRKYVKKQGVTMNVLVDAGNVVADRFEAQTTPHVFILDQKLNLAYEGSVDNDQRGQLGDEAIDFVGDAIEALLAGKPVEHKKTRPFGCSIKRIKKTNG